MSSFNSEHIDDDFGESFENEKHAMKQSYGDYEEQSQQQRTHVELNVTILQRMNNVAEENLKKGNLLIALENYEKCFDYFCESCGGDPSHPAFAEFFRETLKNLNDQALKLLREDKIGDVSVYT